MSSGRLVGWDSWFVILDCIVLNVSRNFKGWLLDFHNISATIRQEINLTQFGSWFRSRKDWNRIQVIELFNCQDKPHHRQFFLQSKVITFDLDSNYIERITENTYSPQWLSKEELKENWSQQKHHHHQVARIQIIQRWHKWVDTGFWLLIDCK